jgi:hypothetical protein
MPIVHWPATMAITLDEQRIRHRPLILSSGIDHQFLATKHEPPAPVKSYFPLPTNLRLQEASKLAMLAGKRCSPTLILVVIAIIVGTLAFFAVSHGPDRRPQAEPIHQKQ